MLESTDQMGFFHFTWWILNDIAGKGAQYWCHIVVTIPFASANTWNDAIKLIWNNVNKLILLLNRLFDCLKNLVCFVV